MVAPECVVVDAVSSELVSSTNFLSYQGKLQGIFNLQKDFANCSLVSSNNFADLYTNTLLTGTGGIVISPK